MGYRKDFVGTQKRVRISHGKRAIGVRAIEVRLYIDIFLTSPGKHSLWYSLEARRRGNSNEYPKHIFTTNIYLIARFIWSYVLDLHNALISIVLGMTLRREKGASQIMLNAELSEKLNTAAYRQAE